MKRSSKGRETKEKYAVYLDKDDLQKLRDYQEEVGVPVSESIRRAIAAYVENLPNKSRKS